MAGASREAHRYILNLVHAGV
ncbi:hypothetical protein BCEN4_160028 [Burkholderia cenocepacia]|nr:hypothetical protein BCEN4_160028 [Burkholderia cenocepacia]